MLDRSRESWDGPYGSMAARWRGLKGGWPAGRYIVTLQRNALTPARRGDTLYRMSIMVMVAWRCDLCGHVWLARGPDPPALCAKCRKRRWFTGKWDGNVELGDQEGLKIADVEGGVLKVVMLEGVGMAVVRVALPAEGHEQADLSKEKKAAKTAATNQAAAREEKRKRGRHLAEGNGGLPGSTACAPTGGATPEQVQGPKPPPAASGDSASGKSESSVKTNQAGSAARTTWEPWHRTEDGGLKPSPVKWLSAGVGSPEGFRTFWAPECPIVPQESSLSDILEAGPVPKEYNLTDNQLMTTLREAIRGRGAYIYLQDEKREMRKDEMWALLKSLAKRTGREDRAATDENGKLLPSPAWKRSRSRGSQGPVPESPGTDSLSKDAPQPEATPTPKPGKGTKPRRPSTSGRAKPARLP